MPSPGRVGILLTVIFSLFISTSILAQPATGTFLPSGDWSTIGSAIASTLSPIQVDAPGLYLEFRLWSGENLLGTGTIGVRKGEGVWFGLRSPSSMFRYLSRGASISCLLETPTDKVLFHAQPGEYAPFPVVRIEKEASAGFRLDLMMNYRTFTASEPAEFSVHPETAAYLTEKLKSRYPVVITSDQEYRLRPAEMASDAVIIHRTAEGCSGFSAVFPVEGQSPLRLEINPLNPKGPFPPLPEDWITPGARTPTSGFDATTSFCKGFYGILSEMLQPASGK